MEASVKIAVSLPIEITVYASIACWEPEAHGQDGHPKEEYSYSPSITVLERIRIEMYDRDHTWFATEKQAFAEAKKYARAWAKREMAAAFGEPSARS